MHDHPAREIAIVNAVAEALNGAPDIGRALERTLDLVTDRLGLPTAWVWLLDPETDQFYSAAARSLPPYLREPVHMTGKPCWCIEQFRTGKLTPENISVLTCSRLQMGSTGEEEGDPTEGLRGHASVPLSFQNRPLGILNVAAPAGRRLTPDELRLLVIVAHQVGLAVERARLADETTRLVRAEERARIAREIHDTLLQDLTGIALHIEGALAHLDTDPDRSRERLERALALSRGSLEEARRSVLDLRAGPLEGRPLFEALDALARRVTSETGVRVHVRAAGAARLAPTIESEFFRIAQEALANVGRHAGASEAHVVLGVAGNQARLSVSDNGHGFDPHAGAAINRGRQGMAGMRERARALGGSLRAESRPGKGTRIFVRVPLLAAAVPETQRS